MDFLEQMSYSLKRVGSFFPYEYAGRPMRWMPDFRLTDGTFVEIKGYVAAQTQAKFEYFLPSLTVLTRTELREIFDYVYGRYGRNLLALYE